MSDPTFLAALGALTMESAPVFADALTENAARFTCGEADAIRNLLAACGLDGDAFLTSHAVYDQEGDSHYRGRFVAPLCEANGHRPDDSPEPGDRCKDCHREIMWMGDNTWQVAALTCDGCGNENLDTEQCPNADTLCLDCCGETH